MPVKGSSSIAENIKVLLKENFNQNYTLADLYKLTNLHKDKITRFLKEQFGEKAYQQWLKEAHKFKKEPDIKNPVWKDKAIELWESNLNMKEIAEIIEKTYYSNNKILKITSSKIVGKFYQIYYGKEAFKQRANKNKGENTKGKKGPLQNPEQVEVFCNQCRCKTQMNKIRYAKVKNNLNTFICDTCKYPYNCPVCSLNCTSKKGLETHYRHQKKDPKHILYFNQHPKITCPICSQGFIFEEDLENHIKQQKRLGNIKHKEYETLNRSKATKKTWAEGKKSKDEKKDILCPQCQKNYITVSAFTDIKAVKYQFCFDCEELNRQNRLNGIEGKDYIICKICGYDTKNSLISHINTAHKETCAEYKTNYNSPLISSKYFKVVCQAIQNNREYGFEPEIFTKYFDSEEKVQIYLAAEDLECDTRTVEAYCQKFNLPVAKEDGISKFQKVVLESVSKILNNSPYILEASFKDIIISKNDYYYKFDGYFPEYDLIIEAHGYHHYTPDNHFHASKEEYLEQLEKDKIKKKLMLEKGFYYLEVLEKDFNIKNPAKNEDFLKEKLSFLNLSSFVKQAKSNLLDLLIETDLGKRKKEEYLKKIQEKI